MISIKAAAPTMVQQGLAILWPQFAAMAGIAVVLLSLCILRFRKSLE